jgi:hypothetical protein
MLGGLTPVLLLSIGTATTPIASENLNGSVVVGTAVFAHDGDPANPDSRWAWTFDALVPSSLPREAFAAMTAVSAPVLPRLLPTPRTPGSQRALLAQYDLVSLGDVNVTDYAKYPTADSATLKAFGDANTGAPLGSLETTHAVIRATLGSSFLYISGIVNRFGRFDEDVGGPGFNSAQNFVGAYNAGVALAWMLPMIDAAHNA